MKDNHVKIRAMKQEDFQSSAVIISQAFRGKMPLLKTFTIEEVADFMLAGGLFDNSYLQGHYVATIEDGLVGILHLESWQSKKDKPIPRKDLRFLFRKFGFFRVLLSSIGLFFLENKLSKDEMYIDFIAVDSKYRGQGVGSQLLAYGEAIARADEGVHRYTLSVVHENVRAKQLYERLGFKVYETESSRVVELFTGVKASYKLEKLF